MDQNPEFLHKSLSSSWHRAPTSSTGPYHSGHRQIHRLLVFVRVPLGPSLYPVGLMGEPEPLCVIQNKDLWGIRPQATVGAGRAVYIKWLLCIQCWAWSPQVRREDWPPFLSMMQVTCRTGLWPAEPHTLQAQIWRSKRRPGRVRRVMDSGGGQWTQLCPH